VHGPVVEPRPTVTLDDLAPDDPWRRVRWTLLALLGLVFVWSTVANGLPVARLAVLGWVAAAFVIGNVGRPARLQQRMIADLALYATMWLSYDYSRGIADAFGFPLQVEAPRNIDRALFFGTDPVVWLQDRFYSPTEVSWYDVVGSIVYFTHFFVPVAASVVLWIRYRPEWIRYMRRFATVLFAGVATYVILPTAPPWMAASTSYPYQILEPVARPTGRGWSELGLSTVNSVLLKGQQWANPTAAMPSLHAAFALFTVAFFWPFVQRRALKAVLAAFPVAMTLTLMYFGEHYLVDALAGFAYVWASFWFWGRWERRRCERQVATALDALAAGASP
jgi:membrane-associated phospholipid phosphatase